MPFKKNRNSRDDKSTNFNKPARSGQGPSSDNRTKSENPDVVNTTRKKLFGSHPDQPFKSNPNTSEDRDRSKSAKPYGERKSYSKDSFSAGSRNTEKKTYREKPQGERKPYGSRPDGGGNRFDRKPFEDRPQGERKPYGDKTQSERKPYGRPEGERPERKPYNSDRSKPYSDRAQGERKPYGDKTQSERKPYGRTDNDRPERKPYNDRPQTERKPYGEKSQGERKPYGDRPQTERKPYGDRPQGERKPYGQPEGNCTERTPFNKDRSQTERKPFTKGESNFEKKPFQARTADSYRPYDRENNYRSEDRKWSSEEKLKTVNRSKKPATSKDDGLIRLNRYIANAGICSRRKADELIAAGVVSVNGEPISELGYKVDPAKDVVRYNGEALKREKMVYVLLNKPKDYITTTDDPQERKTVMNLVEKASKERIYPVGRLDRNTTGLLLMTNDGDLAEKLSHPRNNVTKIYQVELNRNVPQGDLNKIAFGLELEDGLIKPDQVSYVTGGSKNEIGIQIHSGKNRIVRRIFESLGYEVEKLDRVVYSNLTKKDLPRGHWRYLEEKEIIQLKHLIK